MNIDYRNNQPLLQQFMLKNNVQLSPQSSKLSIKRSTHNRNSPKRRMDQQSHIVKSRAKAKPSSLVTCTNDSSISVMTSEAYAKKCHVEYTKPSVVLKKKRRKVVLTKNSVKNPKIKKQ